MDKSQKKRRALILKYRQRGMTFTAIGDLFGISGNRVNDIYKSSIRELYPTDDDNRRLSLGLSVRAWNCFRNTFGSKPSIGSLRQLKLRSKQSLVRQLKRTSGCGKVSIDEILRSIKRVKLPPKRQFTRSPSMAEMLVSLQEQMASRN